MSKYLYGASVQGIQSFIFQTNKLQEIVGASELVEEICTKTFWDIAKIKKDDPNIILNAAGNIKYVFDDEQKCRDFVREFPKAVMEMAPGITISQAVIKYDDGRKLKDVLQDLEEKLQVQRNKASIPFEVGFMGTERSRRTSGVAFKTRKKRNGEDEYIDEATYLKIEKQKRSLKLFEKISEIGDAKVKETLLETDDLKGSWLAVIHADGNGLGAIIQNLSNSFDDKNNEEVKQAFKKFSVALEKATTNAAQKAFKATIKGKDNGIYPIRPIVLGGDDLTVIIRADLAFDFTKTFLKEFERQTENEFKFLRNYDVGGFDKGITACAGIAYVKKSYPFHYAVDLAEKLCSDAKNFVKGKTKEYENKHPEINGLIPKSALAFYKVEDSFIEDSLSEIKERTLKGDNIDFRYGPYLLHEEGNFASVKELEDKLKHIKEREKNLPKGESKGITKLRQWATEVFKNKTAADFFLDRMKVVNDKFYDEMKIDEERKKKRSILYDVIQLNTLNN